MGAATTLSIDAMGGDHAPGDLIEGVAKFAVERADIQFLLHGDEALIQAELGKYPALAGRCTIRHTDGKIPSDMKPSQALRKGKGSSMWNAVQAVKDGEAGASVSGGNTGALMAISMLILRKMDGVHRPAMTALWPTLKGRTAVLDVGANVDATADQLVTFAIMGEAYARATLGVETPKIGLLNIGSEDTKGHDEIRAAHERLLQSGVVPYYGFVEGDDISTGIVDVVVTDGFTGNIALKSGEGVARLVSQYVKDALTANLLTKAGAFLASGGLKELKAKMDPSNVNGGVLLGLNGVSVKSHGGADALGVATACRLAGDLAGSDYMGEIAADLADLAAATAIAPEPAP